ncbi:DNA binding domain-containing protein, excisionase family [Kytococcus aerolatus]|uniref:DNA binding domain-containing protein, excisionase family n=1 Tax=Kytococcus aerolatus TaxID=592308 RepID=A0A212U0A7_9MICO|nr:helix-turn-helix domain-containing protein [Kytococcus aerolatus]SNC71564.1 DNA binding domain-containing protein, excisionase family [Kytococcus aerolatus]
MSTQIPTPSRDWLAPDAAAEHLNVSPRTLRRMVSEGRIPAYRLGPRLIRFDVADLDAALRPIPTVGGGAR